MNIDNLPRGFRREEECLLCNGRMDIYEAFLGCDGVVTRFKCVKCGNIFGLVYSGANPIQRFRKAEADEQLTSQPGPTAEDVYV